MTPITLGDVAGVVGAFALGCAVFDYGMWIWGRPGIEPWPAELKKSVLRTLSDVELRELFHRCCLVRAAPFADQISTLPYQRRIDIIGEILDERCAYSVAHRCVLDQLPIAPDVARTIETLCLEGRLLSE